jgi:hypothetical protein
MSTLPHAPHPLLALLDMLQEPDSPQFDAALAQLGTLDMQSLDAATATALLAKIDALTAKLTTAQTTTAEALAKLRTQTTAHSAYGEKK